MPVKAPLVVLDSSCLISFLLGDEAKYRAGRVQEVLEKHREEYVIALPTIVLLEVLGVAQKGARGAYGSDRQARLTMFTRVQHYLKQLEF